MEKKKIIIIVLAGILSILIITGSYFIAQARLKMGTRVSKEEIHTMYVKINPLVKLTFKEKYYSCDDSEEASCDRHFYRVTKYELIDENAKKIYKDLNLKDENLYQAILTLCDVAISNKIMFNEIEITTDSESIKDSDILSYMKSNSENKINYLVHVNYQKTINEKKLLQEESEQKKTYLVTFNSDGGTAIDAQNVEEGKVAVKPSNPTKEGYNFVEWRLDGKAFNFDTVITQDITLEAVWEKAKTTENKPQSQKEVWQENEEPKPEVENKDEPSQTLPVEETPTVPEETPKAPDTTDAPVSPQPTGE